MGTRTRTIGDPLTDETPHPVVPLPSDTVGQWMGEMTSGFEQLVSRQGAVEKSVDILGREVRDANNHAKSAVDALNKIAKSESDRLQWEREQAEKKDKAEAAAAVKAAEKETREADQKKVEAERRDQWWQRVWNAPWFNTLMFGIVTVVLQILGLGYLASKLPAPPEAPPAIPAAAPQNGP